MAEDRGPARGWQAAPFELFLTAAEKETFSQWSPDGSGSSRGGWSLFPFNWLAAEVPENLSPSVLFLAGAVILAEAWSFAEAHSESAPVLAMLVGAAAVVAWWCFGKVARIHGQREALDTPLVQLFGHVTCLVASVFLTALACPVFAGPGSDSKWCSVQTIQLGLIWFSYESLVRGDRRAWSPAPGALILSVVAAQVLLSDACRAVLQLLLLRSGAHALPILAVNAVAVHALPLAAAFAVAAHAWCTSSGGHPRTRGVLLVTLAFRWAACLLRAALAATSWRLTGASATTAMDVICDGLFLTVVSSDLLLANMAKRELHPAIAAASAVLVIPSLRILVPCLVAGYYVAVFADLATSLDMPLFGVCRNVYCDGIYDLCHIGHKNLFRRASKLGNRLFVGVVGDKDANEYKRPPVMSAAEREAEVAACKGVTKVIANAPCFGLTEDFIRKHRIHVVAYGQEYKDRFPDPDDDPYYKVPRKLGIAIPLPRTECFSTSELLERIRKVEEADLKKKSPT